jgi:paraquat-inducible protein A
VSRFVSCESCGLVSEAPQADPTRCPRCTTPLRALKPMALQQSTAYLIAAAMLYVPSNLLPVMSTRSVLHGGDRSHTLIGGIGELWSTGSWELAVIVFVASIVVPMMKMVTLTLLIATAHRRSRWRQRERAKLYRMIEAVGHWSMLDVYVVVMLAGMFQFGVLGNVEAEPGLLAFGAVVVFTMLSAGRFDPRLNWPEADDGRA